ncbi:hypothetical protein [Bacillus sp. FJAT-44742]|uniref:hypothetical protein n=1 Tax=Bacillus sp. FJAT-44742 TaxID=2014005 RepID=UPI0018E25CBF|nr:hypothetical protein [Bacillus sp. FJAT-44742]
MEMKWEEDETITVDASLLLWLNEQADSQGQEELLYDSFLFFLRKIEMHETIRLDRDGFLHRRFWKGIEAALCYQLLSKHRRPGGISLYRFMEKVAEMEHFIVKEEGHARLSQQGKQFLQKKKPVQQSKILRYIWPVH